MVGSCKLILAESMTNVTVKRQTSYSFDDRFFRRDSFVLKTELEVFFLGAQQGHPDRRLLTMQ